MIRLKKNKKKTIILNGVKANQVHTHIHTRITTLCNVENDHDDDNVNEDDDEAPNSTVLYTFYNLTTIF